MKKEMREKFIQARARVIARAKEESRKQNISLMRLLFGKGWKGKWRAL